MTPDEYNAYVVDKVNQAVNQQANERSGKISLPFRRHSNREIREATEKAVILVADKSAIQYAAAAYRSALKELAKAVRLIDAADLMGIPDYSRGKLDMLQGNIEEDVEAILEMLPTL